MRLSIIHQHALNSVQSHLIFLNVFIIRCHSTQCTISATSDPLCARLSYENNDVVVFSIIYRHSDIIGSIPCLWRTRTNLSHINNTLAVDVPVTQGVISHGINISISSGMFRPQFSTKKGQHLSSMEQHTSQFNCKLYFWRIWFLRVSNSSVAQNPPEIVL